jgi:ribosome-binding factor A
MDSTRQQKVARFLQKELSEIFRKDAFTQYDKSIISVTVVRPSADLSFAKVYVSIFSTQTSNLVVFDKIKANTKELRHKLSAITKGQMRVVPELVWVIDDSFDYAQKIDNLLKK